MYTCMYVYVCIHMCIYICICIYIYIYVNIYTEVYIYIYIHIYTHTHTHTTCFFMRFCKSAHFFSPASSSSLFTASIFAPVCIFSVILAILFLAIVPASFHLVASSWAAERSFLLIEWSFWFSCIFMNVVTCMYVCTFVMCACMNIVMYVCIVM